MLLGVEKAGLCGQTSERCKRPNVRMPIKQQGGKFLLFFWLKRVGWGKILKRNRQQEERFQFLTNLSSVRSCADITVPLTTARHSHPTHRGTCTHIQRKDPKRLSLRLRRSELLVVHVCLRDKTNVHPRLTVQPPPRGAKRITHLFSRIQCEL